MTRILTNAAMLRAILITALLMGALLGCSDSPAGPDAGSTFTLEVSGERFTVRVTDAAEVAALRARLVSGQEGVVSGTLVRGHGGFNAPWTWHLDPQTVHVADLAIEVCDGRPSMVEEDVEYWVNTVRAFCPWGAKVVAVQD